MSSKIKVILIGRHVSDLPANIEVIEQRNITWALDAQECGKQWSVLGSEAYNLGAALLLQNVPGVLAVSIARNERLAVEYETTHNPKWGVIVSVPGPRSAGVELSKTFAIPSDSNADWFQPAGGTFGFSKFEGMEKAEQLVRHANGRAKIEKTVTLDEYSEGERSATLSVTVDPIAEFKFSHIEWIEITDDLNLRIAE